MKEIIEAFQSAIEAAERKCEAEKRAKNEAYCFILASGLVPEFREFSNRYRPDDPHRECIVYLESNI